MAQCGLLELTRAPDDFKLVEQLGAGSYGTVYRAVLPDGQSVAVKAVEDSDEYGYESQDLDSSKTTVSSKSSSAKNGDTQPSNGSTSISSPSNNGNTASSSNGNATVAVASGNGGTV